MNTHLDVEEIVSRCLDSWSCLDLQYNHEYEKVERELTKALTEMKEAGAREEREKMLDFLDNEDNQHKARLDWPYGWALDAMRSFLTPTKTP